MMQEVGRQSNATATVLLMLLRVCDACQSNGLQGARFRRGPSHVQVTRQHKKDQWGLDDVVLHSEVRSVDVEKIKDIPEEGVNIHGLYIEGSR